MLSSTTSFLSRCFFIIVIFTVGLLNGMGREGSDDCERVEDHDGYTVECMYGKKYY